LRCMWRSLTLLLLLPCACWVSPDPALWQHETGVDQPHIVDLPPSDGTTADHVSRDQPAQDALTDTLPTDMLPPDLGPPPRLTCGPQTAVGTGQPTSPSDVALTPDRLTLVANASGGRYATSRSSPGQAFGAWSTTTVIGSGGEDPTFFTYQAKELLIVSRSYPASGDPRRLELCSFPGLICDGLPVEDSGGTVTYDMDGPSVAVIGGTVLMVHNIGVGGSNTADIFLAEPKNLSDLSQGFKTSPVTAINQASVKEDDPALSPDGLVILYSAPSTAGDSDLWISQRTSLSDPFPAPEQLADVNTSSSENSAYMAPMSPVGGKTRLELFFASGRSGATLIYRCECTR